MVTLRLQNIVLKELTRNARRQSGVFQGDRRPAMIFI